MAIFSDNFNRADNDALGANWSEVDGDTDIAANTLQINTHGGAEMGGVLTTTSAHAAIADVGVQVTQINGTGSDGGPCARASWSGQNPTMYFLDVWSTNLVEIHRHNGSASGTLLGSGATVTRQANGVCRIEVTGTGGTVTIKSYYLGTLRETVSDTSASRLTAAGQTGVGAWTFGNSDGRYDDFSVDDLGATKGPIFQRRTARFFTRSF